MQITANSAVDRLHDHLIALLQRVRSITDDVERRASERRDRRSTPRVVAAEDGTPRDLAREATCVSLNDDQWARIQEIEAAAGDRRGDAVAH